MEENDAEGSEPTRETSQLLAIELVPDGDFNLREFVEDVQLGEVEAVVSVDHVRVLEHDEIKPSTAAATACGGPVFSANFLKVYTDVL